MKLSMEARTAAGLALAGAVILGLALVAYENVRAVADASRAVWRTHGVVRDIDGTLSAITDAETEIRGYELTGDDSFLAAYRRSRSHQGEHLDTLQRLVSGNPRQQQRLAAMQTLVAARQDLLEHGIALRQHEGLEAVRHFVQSSRSEAVMDQIRQLATEMRQEEESILNQHEQAYELRASRTRWLVAAIVLFVFFLLVAVYLLVARDIHGRLPIEKALHQSEERFRNFVEVSPVGVFYTDAQGHRLYVNQRWCEITGLTAKQAREGEWVQALHPEDRDLIVSGLERAMSQGSRFHSEHRYRNPRSGNVWVIGQAAPLLTYDGKIAGYVGTLTDITERKKMEEEVRRYQQDLEQRVQERTAQLSQANAVLREHMQENQRTLEALRESQQRLSLYIMQTPMAAIEWGHDLQVIEWNLAAEKVFGYTRAEALGRNLSFIVADGTREHLNKVASDLFARRGGTRSINENITKEGKVILCEWYSTPLVDSSGQVVGLASLANDITEHRSLEQQFRQAQKMEAVGQLAGGIAHDFNNFLSAILGYSEIVLDAMAPDDPQCKRLEHIQKAGRRAAALVRQLLAFSRKQVLALRVMNLNVILQDMDQLLCHLIGENIQLQRHADPSLGQVKVDPGQIEQVIMNLAVNARDAMPQGGQLTLEAANVTLDEEYCRGHVAGAPGEYVVLTISDTGTGMDKATQEHIFEPFYTTKGPGKGTGLGLSTAYGIVKQSGGCIWVYSEPGKGTTFKIYLPRVDEKPQPLLIATPPCEETRGTETILVVEDDEQLRAMACEYLTSQGYTVLAASNGAEAISIVKRHRGPIELVITDVVMPGMSGPQLVQKLAALRPQIKPLYVSGYAQDAIVHHGELDPGIEFVAKPFKPSDLARKVRSMLNKPVPA